MRSRIAAKARAATGIGAISVQSHHFHERRLATEASEAPNPSAAAAKQVSEKRKPPGFWKDISNQRTVLEELAPQLGVTKLDDWYNVTHAQVLSSNTRGLLSKYGNSLVRALESIYPDHRWERMRFSKKPNGFYQELENQRKMFDTAAQELGLTDLAGWYSVTPKQLASTSITSVLNNYHNGSLYSALQKIYPSHNWVKWDFNYAPRGIWKIKENRREFFDWAGSKFGIDPTKPTDPANMSQWYDVNRAELLSMGAASIIVAYYQDSVSNALNDLYPEFKWDQSKFKRVIRPPAVDAIKPQQLTHLSPEAAREVVDSLSQELGIKQLSDWYRVSVTQRRRMTKAGTTGRNFTIQTKSLIKLLREVYPDHPWDFTKMSRRNKRAEQRALKHAIHQILPSVDVIEEYSDPENLIYPRSSNFITVDLYIPSLKVALEYQGRQHAEEVRNVGGLIAQQQRDEEKSAACNYAGISLIWVPASWDGSTSHLLEIIKSAGMEKILPNKKQHSI